MGEREKEQRKGRFKRVGEERKEEEKWEEEKRSGGGGSLLVFDFCLVGLFSLCRCPLIPCFSSNLCYTDISVF